MYSGIVKKGFRNLALLLVCVLTSAGYAQNSSVQRILPLYPSDNFSIGTGELTFRWRVYPLERSGDIDRFVVSIWSVQSKTVHKFTVIPDGIKPAYSFAIDTVRKVCPKHGRYIWNVEAYVKNGAKITSKNSNLRILTTIHQIRAGINEKPCSYGIEFAYLDRLQSSELTAFRGNVLSDVLFRDYSSLGFVFKQNRLFGLPLDICERISLLMIPGIGADICGNIHVLNTRFIRLYTRSGVSGSCAAVSVAEKHSIWHYGYAGAEMSFMPGENLTLIGDYLFGYDLPYQTRLFSTTSFKGSGYRFGFRLCFSRRMMPTWELGGVSVDMRRVPIEFMVETVRDDYTGTYLRTRKISLGYYF